MIQTENVEMKFDIDATSAGHGNRSDTIGFANPRKSTPNTTIDPTTTDDRRSLMRVYAGTIAADGDGGDSIKSR